MKRKLRPSRPMPIFLLSSNMVILLLLLCAVCVCVCVYKGEVTA
jgi:hypothetical protein